jgi:hypothetical protein
LFSGHRCLFRWRAFSAFTAATSFFVSGQLGQTARAARRAVSFSVSPGFRFTVIVCFGITPPRRALSVASIRRKAENLPVELSVWTHALQLTAGPNAEHTGGNVRIQIALGWRPHKDPQVPTVRQDESLTGVPVHFLKRQSKAVSL